MSCLSLLALHGVVVTTVVHPYVCPKCEKVVKPNPPRSKGQDYQAPEVVAPDLAVPEGVALG